MNDLDRKLNDYFMGYVVRKDLVKQVSSNAAVPSYVLEYLLGQNCATDDDEAIAAGVERVKEILAKHYVERAQANAIQSDIKLHGYMRVIDKVTVILNEKRVPAVSHDPAFIDRVHAYIPGWEMDIIRGNILRTTSVCITTRTASASSSSSASVVRTWRRRGARS